MKKFNVTGMSCAACVARVEKAVKALDGVDSCVVNLLTNSMNVTGKASESDIIDAVSKAGYGASVFGESKEKSSDGDTFKDKESPILLKRFLVSLGFLLSLMYIAMGAHMGLPLPSFLKENPLLVALIQLILCSVVLVINQKFFINGFKGIIKLSPNMDTLVALGSGASFIYSTVILCIMCVSTADHEKLHELLSSELYFESAAMILVLITVGKMLEAISKSKTKNALKSLMKLKPTSAILLVDGKEKEVDIAEIESGDIFVVKAGGQVPVDGVILEGDCALDESTLTGESVPAEKSSGDKVFASTINKSGYIVAKATQVGEETALAKIIKTVTDAVATKAPIAKIADTVSGFFVPLVISIAILTTIIWLFCSGFDIGYSLARGISVLVISCPCALGLATPVAIMVGSGVGAKKGILFKDAAKLEECGKCDIVLLDKTGTITYGEPEVTDIIPFEISENDLLRYAYTLEEKSEHPLASAINKLAKQKGVVPFEITSFKTLSGSGVSGEINGEICFGASYKYASEHVKNSDELKAHFDRLANDGKTPLFFAKSATPLGIIAVRDTIKEDARDAILSLQEMGLYTVMLTGDNEKTANAVANLVGVDKVIASVMPNGKESVVKEMQKHGKVIMVGDGINDSPALASADIGIAIGAGTDVAIDTADIVLMKSKPSDIATAIKLSRATLTNIKENLFWAFIYNLVGIPLAAGAFIAISDGVLTLSPMFGALAMSLSSFCVVTNALRLNLFNEKRHFKRAKKLILIEEKEEKKMEFTFKVEGMMCPHCEARVKKVLEELDGVIEATPSHEKGDVLVKFDGNAPVDLLEVAKNTIEAQGYTVK